MPAAGEVVEEPRRISCERMARNSDPGATRRLRYPCSSCTVTTRSRASSGPTSGSGGIEPLDPTCCSSRSTTRPRRTHGLIIPASAESACKSGVVVAVGDDVHGITPGDKVLYPRGAGFEIRLSGEPKRLVDRRELIARIAD